MLFLVLEIQNGELRPMSIRAFDSFEAAEACAKAIASECGYYPVDDDEGPAWWDDDAGVIVEQCDGVNK